MTKNNMKINASLKRHLIIISISGTLLIADTVMVFLVSIFDLFEKQRYIYEILLMVFGAVCLTVLMFALRELVENRKFISQLELENSYTLGHKTSFYNFDAFKNRAVSMSKNRFLRKYRQFMIAFTCTSA